MSKSITKASAVMLAIMTLLSSIFVVQADAATGDKVTIAFYYCFDSGGNPIRYQQTTSNNGYTVGLAGEELCRITANGEEAYCIEPGHSLFAGDQLTEGSSSVWNSFGTAKQDAINLALLCGKPGSESSLSGTTDEKWAATQIIVWEIVSDCRSTYGSYSCTNTKYIDGITAGGANSGVKTTYNQIVSNMQTIQRIPSFAADSASNAKTYEMNAVNGGYSLTLYDGNSVLDKFNFTSAGGVAVSRSGNTLTLTAKNPINSVVTLSATRVISGVNTSLIAYGDAGLQDVVTGTSGITVSAYFKVTAKSGSLKLVKTSEDGIVSGIQFTVTGTNYSRNAVTNANGEFVLNDLVPGNYTVTEKVDPRYEAQAPKTVVVQADKTAMVSFRNILRKGKLKIVKTSEDGIKADIEFTITGKNYSRTAKSDENGEILLTDLVPGTYTVTEKVDPRYEAQEPKTVKVEADKTAMVSFRNTLRKGNLKIVKTSEDGEIEGIQFVVSGKNYSKTVMTNAEGEMLLPDLVPGTYTVTEIVDERYEAQEPKTVIVEADKTATVSFKNTLRKGDLKIIKKSEDGIVAGIEFTVKGSSFNQTVKTNANGEMLLENLVPGVYTVTESVDDRYEPQAPKRVRVTADKTATVTFKNSIRKSSLKIFKISEDDIVADIEFTVTGANFKQTVRTNEDGEIALENLVPGTYTITESVDDRYEKQEPQTVTVEADKTATVTFKNTFRKGNLKIIKTSEDGIVADILFVIKGEDYRKTAKTNSKGEIVLPDLIPGTYTVTEKVDPRYEAQAPKTVKVEADKTTTVSFKNTLRKGDLKIIKTSEDGIVADIEFTITGKNYSRTAKSDKNGEIVLADLIPGTYTVTEKVDSRYEAQEPKTVKVEADKTATVEFKNTLRKGDLKIIKTSEDGLVADIEFTITGKNYSRTTKSDKNGEIVLDGLIPGTYTVTEKVDSRYESQEPKTVVVKADETATVEFKNTLRKGNLKIIKTSEDGIVADIEFTITGKNYSRTAKSDKNGEIILPDLIPGTYTVTEKVDPRYEAQAPKTVKVEADKTTTVSFKNTLRKGSLKIIKTSEDGIVADIEFTITGKNYSRTAKSDKNGEIVLNDLIPGTYTVTEKVNPRYETQAPKTVKVEADKTATVEFKNTLRKGGLKIIKTSEDGIVADIEFTITGKNYNRAAKSDKNGEIILADLIPGTYTVTEKVDPRYEAQEPKTVVVKADETATVEFKNTLRKGDLKIIKTSEDGIVADIEFTITGKNYSRTAKSDKNGEIILPDLIPGTYTVTEKVDSRYESQEPKTVVVKADETAKVEFKNTLRKGNLKIIKTSEDGIVADIEFTITGENYSRTAKSDKNGEIILADLIPGTYTVTEKVDPRYEAQAPKTVKVEADKTATVEFKNTLRKGDLKIIKTSEDGIVADIEFTITGKSYSRTAKSDKNGEIVLADLVPGTYTVTEKVDSRYESQEPKTVVVKADETATVEFKNTLRKGDLKIIKTSEDGMVADIEFTITGKNYSRTAKSDKNGEIVLADLIPGTYTVTEKVDPRYEAQEPKTVKVEADKTATVEFKNTLRKGDLKIIKTSEDGFVADIEFTITGKNYSRTAKSDKNGEIVLADLIPGTYTVTEKVDLRYEIQEPKTVVVKADETTTVEFKNTLRKGNLKIIKTSEDGIVADIEFTITGKNYSRTAKSGKNGEIVLADLIPGIYTVTEKFDPRYEAQEPKTVVVKADETARVEFKNTLRKGDLKIIKTSEDGIVADIEFTITGKNYSRTAKSDKNGEIVLADLVPGTYTVIEKTDPRYEAQAPKTVVVKADETATVEFKNTLRKGDLKIIKTSEDGIVADIEFTITGKNYSRTAKSDKNGEIVLSDLVPGTYTVTEKVDPRYEAQAPKTVVVKADETTTVEFKNTLRKGDLKIIKTSEDGIVADIEFTITGKNYSRTAKSDKNGEIVLADLIPGTYTVTEKVDSRYESQEPKTVVVKADETATVKFKNTLRKGGLKIIKTSEDGIVADIEFTITGKNYSRTAKSDKNGEIILADLIPGTYTVTEKVDQRYEAQAPKTVKVEADKTATVEFKNTLRKGDLKIIKISEDGIVSDIEFTIKGKNYNRTAKSDKNGEIILDDLIPGTYTVTEKVDPRYEAQAPKTAKVEADKTATVEFKNTLRKGDLKIVKTSENGIVADIEFTITGKNYSRTAKSDKNGEIILPDLIPGTYTVTEKVDPRYEAQEPKTVVVKADETATVSFKNSLRKGNLEIIKTSEDGIVADIEFTITGKSYSRTAKSDKNGEIILPDLIPGTYTVTEKVDPRYEAQEPKTVVIKADKTATVEFKNTLKKWLLCIVKKDSETGKVIPYAGTAFQIYAPDGTLVSMNGVDTFTTNNEGHIITPEPLPYGKGYSIAEVKAPDGYVLDDAPVFFDVIDETTTEENGVMVIMIEKSDPPQKGRITVEKFGEVFADVILTENETSKTYQPVYSVAGLSGAVFKVYADEDITTSDGTVRVKKDTLAATLKTDENGKATSKQLYLGRYRIVEVKAPYGTVLNLETKAVELTYAGQNKRITTAAAEFNNNRQKVKIDLLKIMSVDERFALGINNEVLNVTFGLFADEDIPAANGDTIPKDGLIEVISCDENGFAAFSTDLPFGSYYVQELTTDEHYILSETKYPVVFEYAGQDIDTVHIKVNDGKEIINEPKYGTVKGLKIDRETEETIEGAVFGLFKNGETVFTEDTAILTAISDENGIFSFENVPYGEYIVHEIKPVDGYIPNENNYPVTISNHEEVIEITAVNDRFPEIKTTAMIEGKKEVGATDVFTLEDTIEYKHLIPGKEYVLKGILMDKATNAPFLSEGKEVTTEVVFTPEQANGTVTVSFSFNAVLITEETDIVVFEKLYADGVELAVHADIEDSEQTVKIRLPKIRTNASIDGKKEVTTNKPVTITDTVSFENLTVGKEYKLIGVLMDKTTGKPMTVNGNEITAEVVFTAEKENGEIEVSFTFGGVLITKDIELVVFETLYREGNEIAAHTDINDSDQTVIIRPVLVPPPDVPKTGDNTPVSLWIGLGAVALGAVIAFLFVKFRKKDEDDDE